MAIFDGGAVPAEAIAETLTPLQPGAHPILTGQAS